MGNLGLYILLGGVGLALYNSLKDGDSVKVHCLPEDPMIAQLEKQLLSRS